MAALSPEYQELLKRELTAQYVSHLPALLPNTNTPQQQTDKQTNRSLSAFALHAMLGLSARAAARAVVDDFHDNGIDAIYYDSKTETLHLVQSKLKAGEEFKQDEAQAFCTGIRLLIRQEFATFNQNVQCRQVEIETALANAESIQLSIVYTGSRVSDAAKAAMKQLVEDDSHGEGERLLPTVQYYGPDEIAAELLLRQSYKPVIADIILSHDVKIEEPRVTWYGMVNVSDLVALHNKEGKALYEKNVRYFLGSSKSDVNKGIQATLSNDPTAFFYLNNGVTALCNDIAAKERKANRRRLKVRGLSIINGAQTVASAAEVMNQPNPPDISQARVMLTLIQANTDGTFGPRVTRARNSQNPVSVANFASQDPIQERLRQELGGLGIAYHFRLEATAAPGAASILLEEAVCALSWLAVDARYPVWLKTGKGDVYNTDSDAYKTLFIESLSGVHLANAVYFSRAIQYLVKQADRSSSGLERLVYRHGIHAIGWSYLKRLRNRIFVPVPVDPGGVGAIVSHSFDAHRQVAVDSFSHLGKGPLGFFKSQSDTTPYLLRVTESAYGLQNHLALPALMLPQGQEAFPRERLLRFLSQNAAQV
ncbi:AIPR family protein [Rhodoferax ferrireducens]|uniref:AIPR family protein n=1 Tax=Rhodoferax ferrireducens TaxID=192843 RepID=UPI003BB74C14